MKCDCVFLLKTIFDDGLQTRQINNQFKELMLKGAVLNRMTHLDVAVATHKKIVVFHYEGRQPIRRIYNPPTNLATD